MAEHWKTSISVAAQEEKKQQTSKAREQNKQPSTKLINPNIKYLSKDGSITRFKKHPINNVNLFAPQNNSSNAVGRKVYVTSMDELKNVMNHTVPEVLISNVDPYEYLRQKGHPNLSGVDILPFVMPNGHRARRNSASYSASGESCPTTWSVNMVAERIPVRIWKAVCNLAGTTCLSGDGRPNCEEFTTTYTVKYYLGNTPDGKQVWQERYEAIPIACTCSSV
eukprot:gene8152-9023_t